MLGPFSSHFQRMAKKAFQKDPRRGDDRNLVIVDQDFGQPDLEDRMWLFWVRNRGVIILSILLVIVATLGYIVWHAAGHYSQGARQAAYQEAGDKPEAKLAFARDYAGTVLAGVAALEAADVFYEAKEFSKASEAYALARTEVSVNEPVEAVLAARAATGEAFSLLAAGKREPGKQALQQLAGNGKYPEATRGQAMYTLALLALEDKSLDEARRWLDQMDQVSAQGFNPWQQKKLELLMREPALVRPVESAETSAPEAEAAAKK